ncbi:Indigoidine synthase A like protein-domain-containing protein [Suillus clintonianus]|uniref:Indigoidine synthase A like protein-domain-containing protein n=1 Tax=Suillus clintonianus TaxID=1904413 RepID=UPI001B873A18|nr:Indigoidine synthase A like protein-domain-containing protein [Suillus clintonianus]KAG2154790.1 Indigoidine synthase A like protein-domain-containing protein [Suillus clintonianus]
MLRASLRGTFPSQRLSSIRKASSLFAAQKRQAPTDVHPEVEDALANGKPVVALESTIITHGMPYPTSLEMAQSVERIVRSTGSIPATIAVIGGRIKIGLHPAELERLADQRSNPTAVKLSRRDIAAAIALKKDGGTTCSSTLIFAALAGIKVFATGGLGGVHRGGENTMDISADLHELTRCPVGLVSAGVKSILDIRRTLEYLVRLLKMLRVFISKSFTQETLGVPVVSYAETHDFPAFYTGRSGLESPWRVNDPRTAARILHTHWQLGMSNGALFAVPIPAEYEAVGSTLQEAVEQAVRESEEQNISNLGKAVTPWLLKRVGELTQGKSLASNIALVENTALVGGQIAVEYAKLAGDRHDQDQCYPVTGIPDKPDELSSASDFISSGTTDDLKEQLPNASLIVVGCAAVDITSQPLTDSDLGHHSTSPGKVSMSLGGVGRNIAEAAHRVLSSYGSEFSAETLLVSPVGDDSFGRLLSEETRMLGMRTDGLIPVHGGRSSVCSLLLETSGGLRAGVADMDLVRNMDGHIAREVILARKPKLLAVDGNLSPDALMIVVSECLRNGINVFFEPTSVVKSASILPAIASNLDQLAWSPIAFASPNLLELTHVYQQAQLLDLTSHDRWWQVLDGLGLGSKFRMDLDLLSRREASNHDTSRGNLAFLVEKGVAQMAINLLPFFRQLVIKCGDLGVIVVMHLAGDDAAESSWSTESTNHHGRYVVSRSSTSGDIVVLQHFPAMQLPSNALVNTTGAGDSLVGALLAALVQSPKAFHSKMSLQRTIDIAQHAALLSLQSPLAVSPLLSSLHGQLFH